MQAKKTEKAFTVEDFLESAPYKIPYRMIRVHQPISFAGIITSDITVTTSKYPGLKIWRTPIGYVLERGGNRATIEAQNVAGGVIDEG